MNLCDYCIWKGNHYAARHCSGCAKDEFLNFQNIGDGCCNDIEEVHKQIIDVTLCLCSMTAE